MAATINQDTVGDKRYYDAENAKLFKENAELKKLVEQMTTALKEVRLYSCSHMQRTTHDTIDAALKAAKEQK
jgi:hypothetical protein